MCFRQNPRRFFRQFVSSKFPSMFFRRNYRRRFFVIFFANVLVEILVDHLTLARDDSVASATPGWARDQEAGNPSDPLQETELEAARGGT